MEKENMWHFQNGEYLCKIENTYKNTSQNHVSPYEKHIRLCGTPEKTLARETSKTSHFSLYKNVTKCRGRVWTHTQNVHSFDFSKRLCKNNRFSN